MEDDMKKGLLLLLVLCLAASIVFAALNSSSDKGKTVADSQKAQTLASADERPKPKELKDMTVQELADAITKILDQTEEAMGYVPGFKKEKDPAGNEFYTYNGSRLEGLEKGKLVSLYYRVQQERARLNTERINRQLDSIRRAQQATAIANQASRITTVTTPPAQPPRTPQTPPRTVETPRTPPAPPPPTRR